MNTLIDKCCFISSQIQRDIILYKNPIDGYVQVFVFVEISHKTPNTPYHEMTGIDITSELGQINDMAFDTVAFEQRLDKKVKTKIRSADNNWIWLSAERSV